jgi:hypothetical protein
MMKVPMLHPFEHYAKITREVASNRRPVKKSSELIRITFTREVSIKGGLA